MDRYRYVYINLVMTNATPALPQLNRLKHTKGER